MCFVCTGKLKYNWPSFVWFRLQSSCRDSPPEVIPPAREDVINSSYLLSVLIFNFFPPFSPPPPPTWVVLFCHFSFPPGSSDVTAYLSSGLMTPPLCSLFLLRSLGVCYAGLCVVLTLTMMPSVVSGLYVFCKTLHGCDFNEILLYETLRHCA